MTEPQVVRRPARFARQTPAHLRNIPFAEDKDYIRADKWDRRVGWGLAVIGAAYLIGLFAGWLS